MFEAKSGKFAKEMTRWSKGNLCFMPLMNFFQSKGPVDTMNVLQHIMYSDEAYNDIIYGTEFM